MASLSASSAWGRQLRDASFRGVPFSVSSDESSFGRRVQVHVYPQRDKPYTEDLGRAARTVKITAYLVGDDYATQRDRLIQAIEAPGPGTLIHPQYGEMQGSINGSASVTHTAKEGRTCTISFSFVESGELTFPIAGAATAQKLALSSQLLGSAAGGAFAGFSLAGLPDFLQTDVIGRASEMLNTVSGKLQMVDSAISSAALVLEGQLAFTLILPKAAVDFVHGLEQVWHAGQQVGQNARQLVKTIKGLADITLDVDLASKGTWTGDSGTLYQQKVKANLVARAIRTTAIAEAARRVSTLPQPRKVAEPQTGTAAGAAIASDTVRVAHPALDSSVSGAASATLYASWDDLVSVRASLNQAIDREQLRTADDGLFLALTSLRADLNRDISARLAQVERTAGRTPQSVLPALVLAADWYDDAGRERDILDRNSIRHPGFVPVTPLRVPAQ